MKTLFKSLMLVAAAATALVSCSKDADVESCGNGLVEFTLSAENPKAEVNQTSGTRTEMEGATPYWSANDKIGVSTNGTNTNYPFTNTATSRSQKTSFTGYITLSDVIYAYYPYTTNGVGGTSNITGAKVDIPVVQNPTATSFDGKADLLIAKPITMPAAGTSVENLQFKRVSGIVKVVLKDKSTGGSLAGQHVASMSVTTDGDNYIAGRVVLDLLNGVVGAPFFEEANSVVAKYTEATQYEIDGGNATYLGVYPRILPMGSKLTIQAETEKFAIKKEITLAKDINILPGKVTTLTISLTDENITSVGETKYYTKVTKNLSDWSGEYLILALDRNICFTGVITADGWGTPTTDIVITNNQIEQTDITKGYACTIEKSGSEYLIKLPNGQYIEESLVTKFQTGDTGVPHSIEYDSSGVTMGVTIKQTGNNAMLRCNVSSQNRFRYFATPAGISLDLYKLE